MLDIMLNILWTLLSLMGVCGIVFLLCLIVYFIFRIGQIIKEDIQEKRKK